MCTLTGSPADPLLHLTAHSYLRIRLECQWTILYPSIWVSEQGSEKVQNTRKGHQNFSSPSTVVQSTLSEECGHQWLLTVEQECSWGTCRSVLRPYLAAQGQGCQCARSGKAFAPLLAVPVQRCGKIMSAIRALETRIKCLCRALQVNAGSASVNLCSVAQLTSCPL